MKKKNLFMVFVLALLLFTPGIVQAQEVDEDSFVYKYFLVFANIEASADNMVAEVITKIAVPMVVIFAVMTAFLTVLPGISQLTRRPNWIRPTLAVSTAVSFFYLGWTNALVLWTTRFMGIAAYAAFAGVFFLSLWLWYWEKHHGLKDTAKVLKGEVKAVKKLRNKKQDLLHDIEKAEQQVNQELQDLANAIENSNATQEDIRRAEKKRQKLQTELDGLESRKREAKKDVEEAKQKQKKLQERTKKLKREERKKRKQNKADFSVAKSLFKDDDE